MTSDVKYSVAVIGGTGPQGKGLGYRFARGGHSVVLGSRAAEKGEAVAAEVREKLDGTTGAVRSPARATPTRSPSATSYSWRCRTTATTSWSRRSRWPARR